MLKLQKAYERIQNVFIKRDIEYLKLRTANQNELGVRKYRTMHFIFLLGKTRKIPFKILVST